MGLSLKRKRTISIIFNDIMRSRSLLHVDNLLHTPRFKEWQVGLNHIMCTSDIDTQLICQVIPFFILVGCPFGITVNGTYISETPPSVQE